MKGQIAEWGEELARALIKPINTAAVIILGITTVLWGAWVAIPFWNTFTSAHIYQYMTFMPESIWGAMAICVGLLMINGVLKDVYRSLLLGSMVGGIFWFVISVFFFAGDYTNTAGIIYLMLGVYCGFINLNIRVNQRIARSEDPFDL